MPFPPPTPLDDGQMSTATSWVGIGVAIVSGVLSAVGSAMFMSGGVKATLDAHDQRLTTLENDTRYEVRALRDTMTRELGLMREGVHDLRNEVMTMISAMNRRDQNRS